jgi:DNA-binding NarL/FixJ family response regulator
MEVLRILIADDNTTMRRGLRTLIESHARWTVCGEAIDGIQAIAKAKELHPDVVLLDISMPNLNGLEAACIMRSELPQTDVIVVSRHDSEQMREMAIRAGVRGYITKAQVLRDLMVALDTVAQKRTMVTSRNGTV